MLLENDKSHAEVFLDFFLEDINSKVKNFSNVSLAMTFAAICKKDINNTDPIYNNINIGLKKRSVELFCKSTPKMCQAQYEAVKSGALGFSTVHFLNELLKNGQQPSNHPKLN